jgi:hypothetical protein
MQVAIIPRSLATARQAPRRVKDYPVQSVRVGMRFGRLTVTEIFRRGGGVSCHATCDCGGGRKAVAACRLLNGNLQSCGCLHPDTIAKGAMALLRGETRHGRLSFLEELAPRLSPKGRRVRIGRFRCDCGAEKVAELRNVGRDLTRSCGCIAA